jgi:hypothetical protein
MQNRKEPFGNQNVLPTEVHLSILVCIFDISHSFIQPHVAELIGKEQGHRIRNHCTALAYADWTE